MRLIRSVPVTSLACVYLAGCYGREHRSRCRATGPGRCCTPHQSGWWRKAPAASSRAMSARWDSRWAAALSPATSTSAPRSRRARARPAQRHRLPEQGDGRRGRLAAARAAVAQAAPQEERYRILLQQGFATRAAYETAQGPAERPSAGAVGRSQSSHRAEPVGLHRTPGARRRRGDRD